MTWHTFWPIFKEFLHKWQNGHHWRAWPGENGETIHRISTVLYSIKHNPDSRRHMVVAYTPAYVDEMALPPCYTLFQAYVANGKLSCQLYRRSAATFLGVPFNIASYVLFILIIAQQCNLDVGDFVWAGGNAHLYTNHLKQVETRISRTPFALSTLRLKRKPESLFSYPFDDFDIQNYQHHAHVFAPIPV